MNKNNDNLKFALEANKQITDFINKIHDPETIMPIHPRNFEIVLNTLKEQKEAIEEEIKYQKDQQLEAKEEYDT